MRALQGALYRVLLAATLWALLAAAAKPQTKGYKNKEEARTAAAQLQALVGYLQAAARPVPLVPARAADGPSALVPPLAAGLSRAPPAVQRLEGGVWKELWGQRQPAGGLRGGRRPAAHPRHTVPFAGAALGAWRLRAAPGRPPAAGQPQVLQVERQAGCRH